jgi:hypothetical protein
MHQKATMQYKPVKTKDGRGTITFTFTIKTMSAIETMLAFEAAGFPGERIDLEVTRCLSEGDKPLIPRVPLIHQINQ